MSGGFAGITESYVFNNRLEVTAIQATSSAGTALNLAYSYVTGNNGNIATQTNNVTSGRTETYTYDPLNRLLTAQAQATSGGDCWGQSFGSNGPPPTLATDALANLFYSTSTKCSSPQPRFTVNGNNQFTGTGISYDLAGDMTADTAYIYTYDAENRIITASGMTGGPYCYTYDFKGLRMMKAHANGGSCTGTVTVDMLYWRNIAGNTIAETNGSGSTTNASYHEYIFFAGRRMAQSNPSSGSIYYYFADHLGSTRVVTNSTGTPCYEADFLPYGTEDTPAGFTNTCSTNYKFTGYERDAETAYGTSSGNDYAFARYYNSRLGRFMSADPLNGDITDPQTLNRYSYVKNHPTSMTDPSGLWPCDGGCGGGGIIICLSCGFGGGHGRDGDGSPSYPASEPQVKGENPNPPSDNPSGDPWVFGCESNGMPCGMNFPGRFGATGAGCTYGSGSCGGMIYGLLNGASGSWNSPWWNKVPFLVGLAKTFHWQPQFRPNARLVKVPTEPRPVDTNRPGPGQDPEGGIDREAEELFKKTAEWLGGLLGRGARFPWGDVSAPAILFPGQRCIISPATCHDDEIY